MVCVCVAVECGLMIWVFVCVWGVGACCDDDDGGDRGAEGGDGDMV